MTTSSPTPAARSCRRRTSGAGRLPRPPPREPPPPERGGGGGAGPAGEPPARARGREGGGGRGGRGVPASSSKNDTSCEVCPPVRPDGAVRTCACGQEDAGVPRRTPARMDSPTAPTLARPGDAPARVLDRYTLLSRLGAGGFGTVRLPRAAPPHPPAPPYQARRDPGA